MSELLKVLVLCPICGGDGKVLWHAGGQDSVDDCDVCFHDDGRLPRGLLWATPADAAKGRKESEFLPASGLNQTESKLSTSRAPSPAVGDSESDKVTLRYPFALVCDKELGRVNFESMDAAIEESEPEDTVVLLSAVRARPYPAVGDGKEEG